MAHAAAQNCAQNMLRYRETHGENPSSDQMTKMAEISQNPKKPIRLNQSLSILPYTLGKEKKKKLLL